MATVKTGHETPLEVVARLTDEVRWHEAQRAKLEAKGADADKLAASDAILSEERALLEAAKAGIPDEVLNGLTALAEAKAQYEAQLAALEAQIPASTDTPEEG